MIWFSALAPLWAVSTRDSVELFLEGLPQQAPCPAYLRDSVLKGQLLPLHTFVEGQDESDVVGVCLPNRRRTVGCGKGCRLPLSPSPASPQLHPVTKMLPAAPGSHLGSRSNRNIMPNTPPLPSIPHHWQSNDTGPPPEFTVCSLLLPAVS